MNDVRRVRPEAGNKYYIRRANGGYSGCIQGSPTDALCNVLANCVGFANGGINEEKGEGREVYPLTCNAENFIERGIAYGLSVYKYPEVGDCIVWQKGATLSGNDGAGHVAIVTDVLERDSAGHATKIITSESGYGSSKPFWRTQRTNVNGNWGAGAGYTYRGCLRIPNYKPSTPTPSTNTDPFPNVSDEELARRVWTGEFGNGNARKQALGIRYNAVQALVNKGYGKTTNSGNTSSNPKPNTDILALVKKTIRGDFGNGNARKQALGSNYAEVQRQVNLNYQHGTTRWDNIKLY